MPTLLFKLNNVPEDEAAEVRQLLAEEGIEFYETDAGNWGISLAAIWVRDEGEAARARTLLERYQHERAERVRAEHEAIRRAGEHETLLTRFVSHPLRVLFYLLAIAAIVYLTVMPFHDWK